MKILRATHLGMCFGVRDAIALAVQQAAAKPLTILGDLVHNEIVLSQLRSQGVKIEHQVADVSTTAVMITAHGASARTMNHARDRGLRVIEATCPLVHSAHRALRKLVDEGCHPVIVGRRDHVEVRGMTEDLTDYDVVLTEADVMQLAERSRFGVIAQTTQPIDKVRRLVGLLRARFPESDVRFIDTVCQPTKQRQSAAIELAQQCDVVVVIGGAHSNNTRELVETCQQEGASVFHIQTADDLRKEWFADADLVGITAGTSTPDHIVDDTQAWLEHFAAFQPDVREPLHGGSLSADPGQAKSINRKEVAPGKIAVNS